MPQQVSAGRLRSRVVVQSNVPTISSVGQSKQGWTTVGSYWCEAITTGGDESMNADQLKAAVSTTFTLRQNMPITPGNTRFLYNGQTYNIISVIKVGNLNAFFEVVTKALIQ